MDDIKEIFEFPECGHLPVQAHGCCWIAYKKRALQRVVDWYGAYLNHLKSHTSLKELSSQNLVELSLTKVVLRRLKDEHGGKVYQGSELHHFCDATTKSCIAEALADLNSLDEQMWAQFEWSNIDLLRLIFLVLDTQSWQIWLKVQRMIVRLKSSLLSWVSPKPSVPLLKLKKLILVQFLMRLRTPLSTLGLTSGLRMIPSGKCSTTCTHHLMPQSGQISSSSVNFSSAYHFHQVKLNVAFLPWRSSRMKEQI